MKDLDISKPKKKTIFARIDFEHYGLLKALAKKNKVSVSEIIRAIIKSYFRKEKIWKQKNQRKHSMEK